jgi:hypothetical protein
MTSLKSVLVLTLAAPLFAAELGTQPELVAHEWGTFTSVAGPDGAPVKWASFLGPADLPCFVVRSNGEPKALLSGLVRMETPVLYFYSTRPQTVSVGVKFPGGNITEWYPDATEAGGSILWDSVQLIPGAKSAFPAGKGESRYYAARNTDATPLKSHGEPEKMIFYRGVGNFAIPLEPKIAADGKIEIRNVGKDPIPFALLFENRGGKMGFRIVDGATGTSVIDPPELAKTVASARDGMVKALVIYGGLFSKEAQAMVETWNDSWFEEGMRVIYIMPRTQVDTVLPLTVQPAPSQITRAFVGRIEVLSPMVKQNMETANAAGDIAGLQKFGRFLKPFAQQLGLSGGSVAKASSDLENRYSSNSCIP